MTLRNRLTHFRASFRYRLFLTFTAVTAAITLLFTALFVAREIHGYRALLREKAALLASLLANDIRLNLYAEDRTALARRADQALATPGVAGVFIINGEGIVMLERQRKGLGEDSAFISAWVPVYAGTLSSSAESALTGVTPQARPIGKVRLDMDTTGLTRKITALVVLAIVAALGFWCLVSFFGYLALRRVTQSFNTLMAGIDKMRQGDLTTRIAGNDHDEAGRAALAVNSLAATLLDREAENTRLQNELLQAMRLEVQEEKRQVMAKLIQTNRMTSLGLLVSSMAHEINNPNGSIRLAGQFLGKAWKDATPLLAAVASDEGDFRLGGIPYSTAREEIDKALGTIVRNTDRIEQVIRDLRSYGLGERNEFRTDVEANQVVNNALAIIRAHGRRSNLSVAVDLAPDLPGITGNANQLEQVVLNLLMNAIQALPDGRGTVSVATGLDPFTDNIVISVKDDGEGISSEAMNHLFEPFFSTRIDRGGSGLGLYITSFIVTEHKGRMEVESGIGAGTTVRVFLPPTEPTEPVE